MRRKGKRDEARGIVHEPNDGEKQPEGKRSSALNFKPSPGLNLKSAGSSEFAPPPASSLSAVPTKRSSSAKPGHGPPTARASSAKRAKLAKAFKAGAPKDGALKSKDSTPKRKAEK